MEVFAEPESTICLRGQKFEATLEHEGKNKTATAVETSISISWMNGLQMIKAFGPVTSTWFFQ